MRRWFRFSLRTLLALVTVLSVWLGLHARAARMQADAVRTIREYGGWVRYDYHFSGDSFDPTPESPIPTALLECLGVDFFHSVRFVDLITTGGEAPDLNENQSRAPLHVLAALPKIRNLSVFRGQVTDESLRYVSHCRELKYLTMFEATNVTDDGVRHLRALRCLRSLRLTHSQITDESLRVFGALPALECLEVSGHCFSDDGLRHLSELRLRRLELNGSPHRASNITDRGLQSLRNQRQLAYVEVFNTQVTDEGVARLSALFPTCDVRR